MKKHLYMLLLFMGTLLSLQAQIAIKAQIDRTDMLPGEPVMVKVTITNNTGQVLNLQNVAKVPWLSLNAVDNNNRELNQMRIVNSPPLTLEAGKSTSTTLPASQLYDMTREGSYRVYAVVNTAEGENYVSNRAFVNIRGGMMMWTKVVGIPKGYPGAGSSIRYSLLSLSTKKGVDLFVKIEDSSTGTVFKCARLGTWERFSKPIARVDAKNNLHVLFLNTSTIYVHSMVNVMGQFGKHRFYKRLDSTSPSFVDDGKGSIIVMGAAAFDPHAPKEKIRDGGEIPL